MSGAIMPAPLAMPIERRPRRRRSGRVRVATFGNVSVVMMARAASRKPPGRASAASRPRCVGERRRVERLADHAGRGEEHFVGPAADRRRRPPRRSPRRRAALHAGEGVGVAGIDDERPRLAARRACARSPLDRRGGAARRGEDAGDRRRRIEADEEQVGPPLVADAGLGGREPDAGDRRQRPDRTPARKARRDPPSARQFCGCGCGGSARRRRLGRRAGSSRPAPLRAAAGRGAGGGTASDRRSRPDTCRAASRQRRSNFCRSR